MKDRDGDLYTHWDQDIIIDVKDMYRIAETKSFWLPDLWPSLNYNGSRFIYDKDVVFGSFIISSNINGTNDVTIDLC